jgi:5-methyltetrahydropteroyltriglutamate--homocysteine methyltransferase
MDIPEDKILCPGVIEPQSNYIEHPELVAQRIERWAGAVGAHRLMAGVDCGFSVHVGLQGIDPDVAFAKLGSLARGVFTPGHCDRPTNRRRTSCH